MFYYSLWYQSTLQIMEEDILNQLSCFVGHPAVFSKNKYDSYIAFPPARFPHDTFTIYCQTVLILGGMIVLYLCAQLAVLYTYNCLLILIY